MDEWKEYAIAAKEAGKTYSETSLLLKEDFGIIKSVDQIRYAINRGEARRNARHEMVDAEVDCRITEKDVLESEGYDASKWRVSNYRKNGLSVKPIIGAVSLEEVDAHFSKFVPKEILRVSYSGNGKIASVEIADLHLGKLCWHGDTPENFDSKIARDVMRDIVGRIVDELCAINPEYIIFVWSNDFFNSDTIGKTTTGLTPQDTDCRWQRLFNIGMEVIVESIEALRLVAPVKTFYLRSNHDQMSAYYAIKYIDAWYRNCEDVDVDISAYSRKYLSYGNTLLGFGHGDKETAKRLSSLMPIEARELWGTTKFREMHVAHLHSENATEELNGVIVRRISSPTALDTWHIENGFLGAVRKAQTFIYDKDDGLVNIINTPVR
jgi:hypothetical protein